MIPIAREGLREIAGATLILGAMAFLAGMLHWALVIPFLILWLFVICFFRDPPRSSTLKPNELCAPADGTVTEVSRIEDYPGIDGQAVRIGIFLSLFNVHINRSPCAGEVRSIEYKPGEFRDARDPKSGERNESNTLVIDPPAPTTGPVIVRQVAGVVARRIICHTTEGTALKIGERFGLIKFGSRTELIIPHLLGTEILVKPGDRVRAGLTALIRQPLPASSTDIDTDTHTGTKAGTKTEKIKTMADAPSTDEHEVGNFAPEDKDRVVQKISKRDDPEQ